MVAIQYPSALTRYSDQQRSTARSFDDGKKARLEAFNDLVLAHQDAVYHQALWIMGDDEAAADAAQEAFLRAFRKMDTFNGGPFRPWILKITTNYCLDQLRQQKRHLNLPLDAYYDEGEEIENPVWLTDTQAPVEAQVEQSELRNKIKYYINHLPPKYRAAVILVDIQEMDYQEAASVMGVRMGTFKSRLSRARTQLQQWLQTDQKIILQ